jgi:hypothetical protein
VEGNVSVTDVRRLQAPTEHEHILAAPPLAETGRLLADNRRRFNTPDINFFDRPWTEIRRQAQQEAIAASKNYLTQAGEPLPPSNSTSLFLAGHQPDLFHPGVWIKNFALCGLAKSFGVTPFNLIVDSDAAKATSIRVPALAGSASARSELRPGSVSARSGIRGADASGSKILMDPDQVKLLTIPLDRWTREVPYEELRVLDEATFAGVESQVTPILQAWGVTSIFGRFWQTVMGQRQRTDILGERLAGARRVFERQWNCHNWELPVSRLCRTPSFATFACHLFAHLPRFQMIYNESIRNYRRRYGVRSRSHPVPALTNENGWLETPFWAWRTDQPRRRPLLARPTDTGIELRLENETIGVLPRLAGAEFSKQRFNESAVAGWQQFEAQGFKIRSRALITTLYARMFLGDVFIHGIGGGKYDELTDEIIRRFYHFEPPTYLVLSGTLHLPLSIFPAKPDECRRLARDLRDLHWNPQSYLNEKPHARSELQQPNPELRELLAKKAEWIARQPADAPQRQERFQMLRQLTTALHAFGKEEEELLQGKLIRCRREVQANRILQGREYAFCLHPEETLRPFCTQFLEKPVIS